MEGDNEKAVEYIRRAAQLLAVAATISDHKQRQFLVECSRDFERLGVSLIPQFRAQNSN